MKKKGSGSAGRVGLVAVLAWLAFSARGGGWAREAFDADYRDCPSPSRWLRAQPRPNCTGRTEAQG